MKFHFVSRKDYSVFAGPDWPSYQDFQSGMQARNPAIRQEIDEFVEMMHQTFLELTPDPGILSQNNQHRQQQIFFDKQYKPNGCKIPWNTLGINANGNAFICSSPSWIPKFVGNIISAPDIWAVLNSVQAQQIRQEIANGRYYYCNNNLCNYFRMIPPASYQHQPGNKDNAMPFEPSSQYLVTEIPSQLIFDFDYTCNFVCPSCRTELINNNKHHVIRPINNQIVNKIKTEIIDRIKQQPVDIRWAGGEPFISESYLELFEYIGKSNKSNISHTIQTNGSYLKNRTELLDNILPSTAELRISFDAATAETYAKTRVGGVWNNLLDNVRWIKNYIAKKNYSTAVSADFVVQKANYQEIPQFESLCAELGITKIQYQKMWNWDTWPSDEFKKQNVFDPTHSEYPQLIKIFRSIGKSVNYDCT